MRHRRHPRPARGRAAHRRGAEAARIPRLRQRRHRHAAGRPPRPPPRRRQARGALRPLGAGPDPRPRRHRPHPLGDARRADRVRNAHPHAAAGVAVVHNGIIENHRALRAELEAAGATFETETDTEVVVQLCAAGLARGLSPVEAARATLARLEGAFALCFLFDGEDDLLVAARRGSPLAIGQGDGETFVGSDALALAPFTSRVVYLDEGDHAVLSRERIEIFDAEGRPAHREVHHVPAENFFAEKGPYKHFMAKEMHEQPQVVADALARYLAPDRSRVLHEEIDFSGCSRIVLVACGTAHYACHVAQILVREPRPAAGGDRGRLRVPLPRAAARSRHPRPLRQPVGRDRRHPGGAALRQGAGRAHRLGGQRRDLDDRPRERRGAADPRRPGDRRRLDQGLHLPADRARHAGDRRGPRLRPPRRRPKRRGWWRRSARRRACSPGRWRSSPRSPRSPATSPAPATCCSSVAGAMYPLALEGALKLKEISYIHAEGYASGELKHGPIALIDEEVPVIVLAPSDRALRQDGLEHAGGDGPRRPGAARLRRRGHDAMPAAAPGTG